MIEFSARESELFGVRFGRATITSDFKDWERLRRLSADMQLDYLRLKVVNPEDSFLDHFCQADWHADLMGVIRLYKIVAREAHAHYDAPVARFQKVTESDKQLLKDLLIKTYTEVPFGFFQYKALLGKFPLEKQLENIGSYIADNFCGQYHDKEAYIGYVNGKPIECFASDFSDGTTAVTLYAGILTEHRDHDLFKDMIRFFKQLCWQKGMAKSICGARLENLSSQYAMEREGSVSYGTEWVYMISFDK